MEPISQKQPLQDGTACSSEEYPTTAEEFLAQGWERRICEFIRKYRLSDVLNTPEDLTQEALMAILKPGVSGKSYLERFNPGSYTFAAYIMTLVRNLVKTRGTKEGSRFSKVQMCSLEVSCESFSSFPSAQHVYYAEYLDVSEQNVQNDTDIRELIADTIDEIKNHPLNIRDRSGADVREQGPVVLLRDLLKGYSLTEISERQGVPKHSIYLQLQAIRETQVMQRWYAEVCSKNRCLKKTHSRF